MNYKISWVRHTGRQHLGSGIPCQDQVNVCRERGIVCAALADGAGSRESSHIGAACVTGTIAKLACQEFEAWWRQEDRSLAAYLIQCCLEELERQTPPIYELASTLLFFAADREGRYLSGHLGDGVQIQVTGAGVQVFSTPENGEFENETFFLTGEDALEHFRLRRGRLAGRGGFLMMSDGMGESLYQRNTQTPARACATVVDWLLEGEEETIERALQENTQRFFAQRSADDLGLVVMTWDDGRENET